VCVCVCVQNRERGGGKEIGGRVKFSAET